MKRNFTDWILFGITVAAALIGIVMVIYKVSRHSPTIEEALLVFVAAITGLLINHMNSTSKLEGYTKAELTALRRDVEEVKCDLKWLVARRRKVA